MGSLRFNFSILIFAILALTTKTQSSLASEDLRILTREGLSNINFVEQVDPLLWQIRPLVFNTLLEWDSNKAEFKPSLVNKWSWDDTKTTLHMSLDPKAQWHDGKEVTAEDVAFSLNLHAHPESKSIYLKIYQDFVASVEVLGKKDFKIHFKSPSYYHLVSIGLKLQIYPRHIYAGPKGELVWNKKWLGSGPYRLKQFVPDRTLKLESKTKSSIEIDFISSLDLRLEEVKKGNADWAQLTWREALGLKKRKQNLDLIKPIDLKANAGVIWLLLNHVNPHLASTEVRKALMYGFDRSRANSQLYNSFLKPSGGYWPHKHPYASSNRSKYNFDPKKAVKLLKAAGYADSDHNGTLDKVIHGKRQELSFKILTLSSDDGPLVDLFIQAMKNIGVKVAVESSGAQEASRRVTEGQYDAYVLYISKFFDDLNLKYQFHSARKQKWPVIEFTSSQQKKLDKILDEIEVTFSDKARKKLHRQADEIFSQEMPYLFWYEVPDEFWLKAKRTKGLPPL